MRRDGVQLAGLGVAADEERVEDAQRASALDPLQGADEPALELGVGAEPVEQELRGGEREGGTVDLVGHDETSLACRAT